MKFATQATHDIFDGKSTAVARRALPVELHAKARRLLDQMNTVTSVGMLRIPPGNRLELLRGDRAGQYSVRINGQYRVCFVWVDGGALDVEITDYH